MSEWIKCSERLPIDGKVVLAHYINRSGMKRTIRAQYIMPFTIEAEDFEDPETDCVEYSEKDDCYYLLHGWYECIDNWDEYYRIAVNEGNPTHWQPLPPPPEQDK